MKYIHPFKQKIKIAGYLALLSVIIIIFNLFMKNNVSGLERSVESMYRDRLVAAAMISSVIEITYENHLRLEEHMHTDNRALYEELENAISHNNAQTDSLLHCFKQTLLVEAERIAVEVFIYRNNAYRNFQKKLLALSRQGEKSMSYDKYLMEGNQLLAQVLLPAHQLSGIQTSVGKEIYKDSQSAGRDARIISTLEAGLVLLILSAIYGMLRVSHSLIGKQQKFWLN